MPFLYWVMRMLILEVKLIEISEVCDPMVGCVWMIDHLYGFKSVACRPLVQSIPRSAGNFASGKTRRMGNSPHGKFAVQKFHREGISLRENSPHRKFTARKICRAEISLRVISSRGIFTARKIHRTGIRRNKLNITFYKSYWLEYRTPSLCARKYRTSSKTFEEIC